MGPSLLICLKYGAKEDRPGPLPQWAHGKLGVLRGHGPSPAKGRNEGARETSWEEVTDDWELVCRSLSLERRGNRLQAEKRKSWGHSGKVPCFVECQITEGARSSGECWGEQRYFTEKQTEQKTSSHIRSRGLLKAVISHGQLCFLRIMM